MSKKERGKKGIKQGGKRIDGADARRIKKPSGFCEETNQLCKPKKQKIKKQHGGKKNGTDSEFLQG
jgi:hypothetical protein